MLEIGGQNWFEGTVLGIETSCDETSAGIVSGLDIKSNVVSSQAELHKKWGGIVPEAAARAHVEAILPVIEKALNKANTTLKEIKAIAVTNRPGLVGALSVGVTAAKALSFALKKPLIGVHHLEGHLLSPLIQNPKLPFPQLCLLVSGGHTELVLVKKSGHYEIKGQTRDDAAGEAFDKSARLLGLGYPGGHEIQEQAKNGNPKRYALPRALEAESYDFSFSGLKTAVLRLVENEQGKLDIEDAAASVQSAITEVLSQKTLRAAEELNVKAITLSGGVAANQSLRSQLKEGSERLGIPFAVPPSELCTDNAAMIAFVGAMRLGKGESSDFDLDVYSNADLP